MLQINQHQVTHSINNNYMHDFKELYIKQFFIHKNKL